MDSGDAPRKWLQEFEKSKCSRTHELEHELEEKSLSDKEVNNKAFAWNELVLDVEPREEPLFVDLHDEVPEIEMFGKINRALGNHSLRIGVCRTSSTSVSSYPG